MNNKIEKLLFDEDSDAPITLVNEQDKEIIFEQVFATVQGDKTYCILHPITAIFGLKSNEAVLFRVEKANTLIPVEDKTIVSEIFAEYYSELKQKKKELKK